MTKTEFKQLIETEDPNKTVLVVKWDQELYKGDTFVHLCNAPVYDMLWMFFNLLDEEDGQMLLDSIKEEDVDESIPFSLEYEDTFTLIAGKIDVLKRHQEIFDRVF